MSIDDIKDWVAENSDAMPALLGASFELLRALQPKAAAQGLSLAGLVNDDPVTVRALADGAGLARIAGAHGVTAEQVLKALGMVARLGILVTTVL